MWFTETPWPPMLIFLVATMGCGWMWAERRQPWWLVGAIGSVALTAGVWGFERSVITPQEQIEQHIVDLAQAFQERDEEQVLSYISPRAKNVRDQVKLALWTVTRVENLRITDTDVTLLAAGSLAKLHFRANGTVTIRSFGDVGHHPTRWLMTWRQEGGLWKIIDVERLDPFTGEPMGLIDAQF